MPGTRCTIQQFALLLAILCGVGHAAGATFYLSTTGDDANPGTLDAPFRTFARAVSVLKPGDTLLVRAGTYTGSRQLQNIPSGTSWDNPVTIKAHPGERPVIVAEPKQTVLYFTGNHYIVIDGFIIDARDGHDGIKITYVTGGTQAHHIRIQNTEVKNATNQGLLVAGEGNEFINLDVHDNGTNGFHHGIYLSADRNLIDGGKYYRNAGWGIHVYPKATNTIVRNVRAFENGATGLGLVWGSNNQAYNNFVYRNGSGIHLSGDSPRCYNNTVFNNRGPGLSIANADNGPNGTSRADVRNNIVFGNESEITDFAKTGTILANNLTADPGFVDAAAADFRLREDSPAIDAGADLRAQGVSTDFEGDQRPQGKAFDIGADEFTSPRARAGGPLRVHPDNPRYFTDGAKLPDGSNRAIYLTGSHTWPNLIDRGPNDPPPPFDFDWYLDFLEKHDHNFIRLWSRHVTWYHNYGDDRVLHAAPLAWARTGPGLALDGKPKFDLTRFNQDYFDRLRSRVIAAGHRGIYVSVMLFGGYYECTDGFPGNPFNAANNINGIDGDPNQDGRGLEIHTLALPPILRLQEAYVRKVLDTVNDLDNVLYEISNESHTSSIEWQYHLIRYIHDCEKAMPKQHPVGMTALWGDDPREDNRALLASPAAWVSPLISSSEIAADLPIADPRKVSLLDSDHWFVFEILSDPAFGRDWVWKAFCRGHNPILMEQIPADSGSHVPVTTRDPGYIATRTAMRDTRRFADRINLAAMTPASALASTNYCLANPGTEYLIYLPTGGPLTVDLSAASGHLTVEWFKPGNTRTTPASPLPGGARRELTPPFNGPAVLHLRTPRAEN